MTHLDRKKIVTILNAVNKMQQYMIKNGKDKVATCNRDGSIVVKIDRKHWVDVATVTVKNFWSIQLELDGQVVAVNVDVSQLEDMLVSRLPVYTNTI